MTGTSSGDVVCLGVDSETASSITMSQLSKYKISSDVENIETVKVISTSMVLVKGKVLFLYVYRTYNENNDIKWARKTAEDYIMQLASANEAAWPLADGSIVPEGATLDTVTKELLTGDFTEYNLKYHPKAHGVDVTLKYPQSWKAEEGVRPHIIQKFIGEPIDGILPSCMVIVINVPKGEYFSYEEDITEEELSDCLREMIPDGGVYIDGGRTKIDGETCDWLKLYYAGERAGVPFSIYALCYRIFLGDKVFLVLCSVEGAIEDKVILEDSFNTYLPVFQAIGNSIVINEKWNKHVIVGSPEHTFMEELFGEYWFLTLLVSAILTWGIGLIPPILIRYAISRRPLSKKVAIPIVVFFWVINIVIFTALGSQSRTHAALFLVAWASYYILHRGYRPGPTKETHEYDEKNTHTEKFTQKIKSKSITSGRLVKCSNCSRTIGKLEVSFDFNGKSICLQCHQNMTKRI